MPTTPNLRRFARVSEVLADELDEHEYETPEYAGNTGDFMREVADYFAKEERRCPSK